MPPTTGSSPRPWGTLQLLTGLQGAARFIPTPVGNTRAWPTAWWAPAVHPHARGEHHAHGACHWLIVGSSPRPWGTPDRGLAAGPAARFIPTPVGNTVTVSRAVESMTVHPHARGEHPSRQVVPRLMLGSSPRPWGTPRPPRCRSRTRTVHPHARGEHGLSAMPTRASSGSSPRPWGTHGLPRLPGQRVRFIPTPVGNTASAAASSARRSVHPHARGEHPRLPKIFPRPGGSSPRPWGTLVRLDGHGVLCRFIPTPVGNTSVPSAGHAALPVHPHARGEHTVGPSGQRRRGGSSPRPWGTPRPRRPAAAHSRFIPTPVGNTRSTWMHGQMSPVHPHARGEHFVNERIAQRGVGSSPRPWGTLHRHRRGQPHRRFIPTPVGNTHRRRCRRWIRAVHPHARGEHVGVAAVGRKRVGSSPRPWGTHQLDAPCLGHERFIPTPVGNTPPMPPVGKAPPVHPHARGEHFLAWVWHVQAVRFIPTPVGNTTARPASCRPIPVHPHARGEHPPGVVAVIRCGGSSPRPWGTPTARRCRRSPWRFIPTPVGNTSWVRRLPALVSVHPHARGEHREGVGRHHRHVGSSPRPWGTRALRPAGRRRRRFIPTPVGNTPCAPRAG